MPKVHALLVGINKYAKPEFELRGCVNDVQLAEQALKDRVAPGDLVVETLLDAQATRTEVIDTFRSHLGRLGPGDTALFWYSGHGSTAPLPAEIWYAESSGMCQTLVCHDSRAGASDLYDKELGVLAAEVVATGARLVTIVDACHSRSAMRDIPADGLVNRLAPASDTAPELRDLLPELGAAGVQPGQQLEGHVAFAACDEWSQAKERKFGDDWHGLFSQALGTALARLGPQATYRQVFNYARCHVEARAFRQLPALEVIGDLADDEFLGGTGSARANRVTLYDLRGSWRVDVGSVHGVVVDAQFGVHRADPLREVRVTRVYTRFSLVEPLGWKPDDEQQYEMVLTDVPLPPVAVTIDAAPEVAALLTAAVETAGPGGGPSPHIRVAPADGGLALRVGSAEDALQITGIDGKPLAALVGTDGSGIGQTVRDLEHIARWLQVRNLESASPALEEAVQIQLVPAPEGGLILHYADQDGTWVPPVVSIRLHNTTDRKLYCVLLDLTDRYRMHANLFPGAFIKADWSTPAGNGGPIKFSLPPGRKVRPGASGTDWLILLVAEEPFNSDPFSLPRLGEPPQSEARGPRAGITGVLDRLGLLAVKRDADVVAPAPALGWAIKVVELTTRVP